MGVRVKFALHGHVHVAHQPRKSFTKFCPLMVGVVVVGGGGGGREGVG